MENAVGNIEVGVDDGHQQFRDVENKLDERTCGLEDAYLGPEEKIPGDVSHDGATYDPGADVKWFRSAGKDVPEGDQYRKREDVSRN